MFDGYYCDAELALATEVHFELNATDNFFFNFNLKTGLLHPYKVQDLNSWKFQILFDEWNR